MRKDVHLLFNQFNAFPLRYDPHIPLLFDPISFHVFDLVRLFKDEEKLDSALLGLRREKKHILAQRAFTLDYNI